MAMDFSGSAGATSNFDIIPKNQLAWAILTVRGLKASAKGGGYLDCELVIDQGQPYAGRKIWDMIGDPQNAGNSEGYRQMGTIAITRILEAGRNASPNNLAGYQIPNYEALSGLRVAIKVGIEAGTGGHDDKNIVADYLTPNPASASGHKLFLQLQAGQYNTAAPAQAAQSGGFGGFGATAQPAAQPATTGFGNTQPGFQQAPAEASGFASTAGSEPQTSSTGFASTATSPSEPGATPGWLAQAGG